MPAKMLKNLLELLEEEYEYYCKLNGLALEKRDFLIDNDIEGLTRLLEEDNEIIAVLEGLEEKRVKLVNRLATTYKLGPEDINFTRLSRVLPEEWQSDLALLKDKLLQIIEELHNQNEQNKILVEEAVKLNNFSINMLIKAIEPDNQIYDPVQGKKADNKKMTHIIDRRG